MMSSQSVSESLGAFIDMTNGQTADGHWWEIFLKFLRGGAPDKQKGPQMRPLSAHAHGA